MQNLLRKCIFTFQAVRFFTEWAVQRIPDLQTVTKVQTIP